MMLLGCILRVGILFLIDYCLYGCWGVLVGLFYGFCFIV